MLIQWVSNMGIAIGGGIKRIETIHTHPEVGAVAHAHSHSPQSASGQTNMYKTQTTPPTDNMYSCVWRIAILV